MFFLPFPAWQYTVKRLCRVAICIQFTIREEIPMFCQFYQHSIDQNMELVLCQQNSRHLLACFIPCSSLQNHPSPQVSKLGETFQEQWSISPLYSRALMKVPTITLGNSQNPSWKQNNPIKCLSTGYAPEQSGSDFIIKGENVNANNSEPQIISQLLNVTHIRSKLFNLSWYFYYKNELRRLREFLPCEPQ